MIVNTNARTVESTLKTLDEANYKLDQSNLRHVFQILREMYTDPVLAVVREYSANALDAHVMCGKKDVAFDVVVPGISSPEFVIRDFGPGLSDEEVKNLLLGYGASGEHKRISNDMVGGFGIGSKCGFAIADQFTFISIHKGVRSTWLCYRDQDDDCKAKKLEEVQTVFDSGIEVRIPVASDLISSFHEAISTAYRFYDVKPNLMNAPDGLVASVHRTYPKSVFNGSLLVAAKNEDELPIRWEIIDDGEIYFKPYREETRYGYNNKHVSTSYVVMGQVAYPLDFSKFMGNYSELNNFIIRAPIGSIQLAPSRESLSYTGRVKETLKGIVKQALLQIEKQMSDRLSKATSSHDLFRLMKTCEDSLPRELRNLLEGKTIKEELAKRCLSTTGYMINRSYFERFIVCNTKSSYIRGVGYKPYYTSTDVFGDVNVTSHSAHRKSLFYIVTYTDNDKVPRYSRDILGLVGTTLFPNLTNSNGVNPTTDHTSFNIAMVHASRLDNSIPWVKDGSIKVLKFSELSTSVDNDWLSVIYKPVGKRKVSTGQDANRVSYDQHSKKFSKLIDDVESYGGVKSESWEGVDAKSLRDMDKIVYVLHDRFVPRIQNDSVYQLHSAWKLLSDTSPQDFNQSLYGLRESEKDWVSKQGDSLTHVLDYFVNSVDVVCQRFNITRDHLEAGYNIAKLISINRMNGCVPLFLGASSNESLEPELYELLNVFRKHPVLFSKYIKMLAFTKIGELVVERIGFGSIFSTDKYGSILDFKDPSDTDNAVQRVFNRLGKRFTKTKMRRNLLSVLVYQVPNKIDNSMDDLNSHGKINSEKQYQLFLEIEKLDL